MDKNKDVEIAAACAIGLVLIPAMIKGVIIGGAYVVYALDGLRAKIRFKKRVKEGLKDGSVVEINGQYFEVLTNEEA